MKKNIYINALPLLIVLFINCSNGQPGKAKGSDSLKNNQATIIEEKKSFSDLKPIDTALFNKLNKALANGDSSGKWPAKFPYPTAGALLPFNRILAFYGNLYSKKMGVLGEYPKTEMLAKLKGEVKNWKAADTTIPIIPALHYVCVTAQGAPGKDGKYRARMPFKQIDTIVSWAREINGISFLDIQVALSNLQAEVPQLETYLKMPDVHLGIDPEFSMKGGQRPGTVIGTFNADDINYVIDYLAGIVKKNNIPPKILVVHRFTNGMVREFERIKKVPEVQIVMDMDGWGDKILKKSSYLLYEKRDPVMFTGFKLFYKNDIRSGANQLYSPKEVMTFQPRPIYIQYQ